jgi:hypothetical protein
VSIESISAREQAATPGPWVNGLPDGSDAKTVFMQPEFSSVTVDDETWWNGYGAGGAIYDEGGHTEDDAAFIAHARQDVPALLAVAKAAAPVRAFVEQLREHGRSDIVIDLDAIAAALAELEALP